MLMVPAGTIAAEGSEGVAAAKSFLAFRLRARKVHIFLSDSGLNGGALNADNYTEEVSTSTVRP